MKKNLKKEGKCYELNGKWFQENQHLPNIRLVHGEVMGQGELSGIPYAHCWVEIDDMVIDLTIPPQCVPKATYYKVGQIDTLNNTHKYDFETYLDKILSHKHWGPWDLKSSSGL